MTATDSNEPVADEAGDSEPETGSGGRARPRSRSGNFTTSRPFPRRTLEQALRVPRAIKEKNGGNEWDSKEVAAALGIRAGSANFWYLTAASRDYGLTIGTRDSAVISITDLGRRAVYPGSDEEESGALREAFLMVEPFGGYWITTKEIIFQSIVI